MLDSDQEPSHNLSKNLLLLPRILMLIEDIVDDSTPLLNTHTSNNLIFKNRLNILFSLRWIFDSYIFVLILQNGLYR